MFRKIYRLRDDNPPRLAFLPPCTFQIVGNVRARRLISAKISLFVESQAYLRDGLRVSLPPQRSGRFVVAISGFRLLQRCVIIAATVSSTHSLIRAPQIIQRSTRHRALCERLPIRGTRCRIPTTLNPFQQRLIIEEHPVKSSRHQVLSAATAMWVFPVPGFPPAGALVCRLTGTPWHSGEPP